MEQKMAKTNDSKVILLNLVAVSCRLEDWLTGKLVNAWVVHGVGVWHVHKCLVVDKCMCILPGLVMLELGLGVVGGGEGKEGIGCVLRHAFIHNQAPMHMPYTNAQPSLPVNQSSNPTPPNV